MRPKLLFRNSARNLLKAISWFIPHGAYVFIKQWFQRITRLDSVSRNVLSKNAVLHRRHEGKRCFVLGNGPSASKLDLLKLAGEHVISVSSGYLHHGYNSFAPKYHCVPQITYGKVTTQDVVKWFTEMHQNLGDATLFLSETEEEIVRKHGLFQGRTVHYVALRENFDELDSRQIIDITKTIPEVMSVPIMALMLAIYMGFNEIILIGVDHDEFRTRQYKYAFETKAMHGKDSSVNASGNLLLQNHDIFQINAKLWRQYRILSEVANFNNINIINATPGGELDEFPRLDFDTIFAMKNRV